MLICDFSLAVCHGVGFSSIDTQQRSRMSQAGHAMLTAVIGLLGMVRPAAAQDAPAPTATAISLGLDHARRRRKTLCTHNKTSIFIRPSCRSKQTGDMT